MLVRDGYSTPDHPSPKPPLQLLPPYRPTSGSSAESLGQVAPCGGVRDRDIEESDDAVGRSFPEPSSRETVIAAHVGEDESRDRHQDHHPPHREPHAGHSHARLQEATCKMSL